MTLGAAMPSRAEPSTVQVLKSDTSSAAVKEAGQVAWTDTTEGQALWQPGGAEEDSRLRGGNRHLHLAYDDEEEDTSDFQYVPKN